MSGDFIYIEELSQHVGQEVVVKSWLVQKRSSGKINFLVVRDGSGYLQCIHDHDLLLSRIQEHDLPVEAFQWYLEIRKLRNGAPFRLRHGH